MSKADVDGVLRRLKQVLGTASDSALARALDTTPQTISTWKTRGKVPYSKCVDIAQEHAVTLDWLLTGSGCMQKSANRISEALSDYGAPPEQITPKERALLELFKGLTDDDQREICRDVEEKKRMREMEAQLQELQAKFEELKNTG